MTMTRPCFSAPHLAAGAAVLLVVAALVITTFQSPSSQSRTNFTRRRLKGSRPLGSNNLKLHGIKNNNNANGERLLQVFEFKDGGAFVQGNNMNDGTVTSSGLADTTNAAGEADAVGASNFTVSGGSSGFVNAPGYLGVANGSGSSGANGQTVGSANTMDVGKSNFTASIVSGGQNIFGAGLSQVSFNVTTGDFFLDGVIGGFAASLGIQDITGQGAGEGKQAIGMAKASGSNFGGGMAVAQNMFGMAGATVFGAGNGSVGGIGNVPDGLIISTGTALGNFDNIAAGYLGNFGNIGELDLSVLLNPPSTNPIMTTPKLTFPTNLVIP